ncbi:unnamed protein product [Rotaria sp. Silwood2]|nr:unnamed protein product [Rotaria sp. Silwood2]CAF4422834.1 unnamed protein product [Rotaria sp. Silwood2]CAF4624801.1 unnamed protein product [Rotaria sp. Silwood2]CAF4633615.1 unnamed protein product [Rotaria sp. Silwood2]
MEFNRNSNTKDQDKVRFTSFNKTLHDILDDYKKGDKTYTLGLNNHADWTHDEWKILRRGIRVPKGNITNTNVKSGERLLTWDGKSSQGRTIPPVSYDLTKMVVSGTTVPVVLSVKDQGQCGSCYAFAFNSLLEFQYAVQLKRSASLSEQQLVDCSYYDGGCDGGYFPNTFSYLQSNAWQVNGSPYYPYKAIAGQCAFRSTGAGGVIFGTLRYMKVTANNAAAMKQALVDYGPLWVSVFVGDDTTYTYSRISSIFNNYKSGIFQPSGCPTSVSSTNHAVVIVGYGVDTTTGIPYWKVRNSWGSWWGESGYFKIRLGVNMCGIESGPFYVARAA